MEGQATYRIRVRGRLDCRWSERLGDMEVEVSADAETTMLVGRLADQAALSGVLTTLYELHLPVVSVECLECADQADQNEEKLRRLK